MQFTHMFLQVEVPAESFATGGAGEGFLVVVGVHVEGQVVDLMKCLVTDIALELLLPAVSELVVLVITCNEHKHLSTAAHNSSDHFPILNLLIFPFILIS